MKQRRVILSFPTKHGERASLLQNQKVLDGLNIRFDVKINGEPNIPAEMFCDIYNLTTADLNFLTTSAATWLKKQSLIQLHAGYDNDVRLIFSGLIMDAPPSGNPDVALHIRAISGYEWMKKPINVNKKNITIQKLLEFVSQKTGYKIIESADTKQNEFLQTVLPSFSFTGTPIELLAEIQNMCGGVVVDNKGFMLSVYNDSINVSQQKKPNDGGLIISSQTGMVGYPELTGVGVNVKILLNTNIKCGDWITVQSSRVKDANNTFQVTGVRHSGESRGNEFYTVLECRRPKQGE